MLLTGLDCLLKRFALEVASVTLARAPVKYLEKGSWEEDMGAVGIFFSARQRASVESRVSGALDRIKECSWQQAFVLL